MKILKKYFSNIVKTIETEILPSKHTFQDYLKNPIRNTLSKNPITKKEIEQEIKLLKTNKTIGPPKHTSKIVQNLQ